MAINLAQVLGQGANSGSYTPQDVDRRRKLAERLRGNTVSDAGAIGALANTLSGSLAGYEDRQAGQIESEGQNAARERLMSVLGDPAAGIDVLAQAASDPFITDRNAAIASALLGQKMQQSDPAYQLDLAYKQAQIDEMNNPEIENPYMNVGGGAVFNQATGEFMQAPDTGAASLPADVQEYNFYAEQTRAAGQEPLPYLDYVQALKGNGLSITTADGTVIQQGGKALTEGQSKDTVYATRAEGALPIINEFGNELMNPVSRAVEGDQTGLARGALQSENFQKAQQAGKEFLQAILRKDTGAAITPQETAEYGTVYLPVPGDLPGILAQKEQSRIRALEAIKAGLPPQAILAQERALVNTGSVAPAAVEVIDWTDL